MADTKLADMGYTKAEQKEEAQERTVGYDGQPNRYPWGLCLSLESAELEKLGIKDLPQVDTEIRFVAVATVTSVNKSASQGQDEETRVGLQITQMALESGST